MKNILVTGAAGFIGFHLCKHLLSNRNKVIGLDNINPYYDANLKYDRLSELGIIRGHNLDKGVMCKSIIYEDFEFIKLSLDNNQKVSELFESNNFDIVINLAAQAGVRYSIENPNAYIESNIIGFQNILDSCRTFKIDHLIYASSSSVYGENKNIPFNVNDRVDNPISLYAATKKSNELMAHAYSHLFDIPMTGLRFFTVYGPWGRPDMALYLFTEAIYKNKQIKVFNNGDMKRDFTYIDDIISGIQLVIDNPPQKVNDEPPYKLFNIGNGRPEFLTDFIAEIEKAIGKKASKKMMPMQPGDVPQTWADLEGLRELGYKSSTSINKGVGKFIDWYKSYHKITP